MLNIFLLLNNNMLLSLRSYNFKSYKLNKLLLIKIILGFYICRSFCCNPYINFLQVPIPAGKPDKFAST